MELVSVHDVPITLVTVIVHSCHIGSSFQVKCCEQSANKTRFRTVVRINGSVTVSAVNAPHHSRSDSLAVSTQCWSQPK
eukprot:5979781-Amphidinium_carterae.1